MRILIVTDSPRANTGFGNISRLIGKSLQSLGHKVYCVDHNEYDYSGRTWWREGITVLPNSAIMRNKQSYGDAQSIIELDTKYQFNVILWINDAHRYSYLKSLPSSIKNKSIFWLPYEGSYPDSNAAETCNSAKYTIFSSKYSEEIFKKHINNSKGTLYFGFDLNIYKPYRTNREQFSNKFIITRIDRNQPRKRWDKTLEFFAEFAKDKEDVLLYAKCNPRDPMGSQLDVLAETLDISSKVFFDNNFYESEELVKNVYSISDVCFSTTSGEGFGMFTAESIACGIPIITTGCSASQEMLYDCGHLMDISDLEYHPLTKTYQPIPDKDEAISYLNKYYSDWKNGSIETIKMKNILRKKAMDMFDIEKIIEKLDHIIKEVSNNSKDITIVRINSSHHQYEEYFNKYSIIDYSPEIKEFSTPYIAFIDFDLANNLKLSVEQLEHIVKIIDHNKDASVAGIQFISHNLDLPVEIIDPRFMAISAEHLSDNFNEDVLTFAIDSFLKSASKELGTYSINNELSSYNVPEKTKKNIDNAWGKSARSKIKIVLHTYIGRGIGYSTIAEGLIPELDKLGFDVYLYDWNNGEKISDPVIKKIYDKTKYTNWKELSKDSINIVCFLMEYFDHVKAKYKIGIAFAESTKVKDYYIRHCNVMNRLLTFANFNKNIQKESGVNIPISVIRPGVSDIFTYKERDPSKLEFNILIHGVCQQRKRTQETVEVLANIFPKHEYPHVNLIIKSSSFGKLEWIDKYKEIMNIETIYTDDKTTWTNEQINELYHRSDVLINTSSGEGIGYAIAEGMATGLPVIYNKWSAPAELFASNEIYGYPLEPSKLEPAYTDVPGYIEEESGQWASTDINKLKVVLKTIYNNRKQSLIIGKKSSEYIRNSFRWEQSAIDLFLPMFHINQQMKESTWKTDYHPSLFVKPELQKITNKSRITIGIPTRNRHEYLFSLFESIRSQTYKNWDLVIIDDDSDESLIRHHLLLSYVKILNSEEHKVYIVRGKQQGPHIAHQTILDMANNPLICRIDDDIIINNDYLEKLIQTMTSEDNIAAVGGLYLDPSNNQYLPSNWDKDPVYNGSAKNANNLLQISRHYDNKYKEVQHLYSSFLYRTDIGRSIGGFYQLFSPIGFREETDFTYRMHISGYKLIINPEAIGYHFAAPKGGLRTNESYNKYNAMIDHYLFEQRRLFWLDNSIALR